MCMKIAFVYSGQGAQYFGMGQELYENYSVQLPKIGAGLAGGNWDIIEQIIIDELVEKGVDTTVILL